MLDARGMWADKAAYDAQANKLAQMFADNFLIGGAHGYKMIAVTVEA